MADGSDKKDTESKIASLDVEESASVADETEAPAPTRGDVPARESLPEDLSGRKLGRYFIMERLGHGGMGVVYKAYDPQLDRPIALKLLRIRDRDPGREERAKDRLFREAQALAQLTHPNVVAVHDVGTVREDIFMTMEYVEGRTLKEWLREKKPPLQQVLDVMIAAGRGIAAAHRAGLIHRDIKPANIIIGEDGRARVLDFGLARSTSLRTLDSEAPYRSSSSGSLSGELPSDPTEQSEEAPSTARRLAAPITLEGRVMGTPGYMAPEQYLGSELNTHTDQFSFCVTLYEALYGKKPFSARSYRGLRYKVAVGRVEPPPADSRVPGWLRRIVLKGLSVKQADRFPSMDALLAALSRDPRKLQRRIGLGLAAALLVAVAVGAIVYAQGQRQKLCRGFEDRLAGTWDRDVRKTVEGSFLASGRSYARDTFERVSGLLDQRAREWVAMSQQACEATHLRGEQSEKLLDLRTQCLRHRLEEMRALTRVFSGPADAEVVDKAVKATLGLSGLARCADTEALLAAYPPPEDEQTRAEVEALRAELEQSGALRKAGKFRQGLAIAQKAVEQARALGYPPAEAEALLALGDLQASAGDAVAAEASLRQTVQQAAVARDLVLRAKALIRQLFVVGYLQARYAEALELGEVARSDIVFTGNDQELLADALNFLGIIWAKKGDLERASENYRRSLEIRRQILGPDHPTVGDTLDNLAEVHYLKGDFVKALELSSESLRITERALGPDHPNVAISLGNVGLIRLENGEPDQALENFQRALVILGEAYGPEHASVAPILNNMASAALRKGDLPAALGFIERSLSLKQRLYGGDHPSVAVSLTLLGTIRLELGEATRATEAFSRSVEILERAVGKSHPNLAKALTGLGECRLAMKKPREALADLSRALAILEPGQPGNPGDLALTRFTLAKALWDSGRDRNRALVLARQAEQGWTTASGDWSRPLAEVRQWLATHSTPH